MREGGLGGGALRGRAGGTPGRGSQAQDVHGAGWQRAGEGTNVGKPEIHGKVRSMPFLPLLLLLVLLPLLLL